MLFEFSEEKSIIGRPRLVVNSSHTTDNKGKLMNMFSGPGSPMLDVADAIQLRSRLNEFIKEHSR